MRNLCYPLSKVRPKKKNISPDSAPDSSVKLNRRKAKDEKLRFLRSDFDIFLIWRNLIKNTQNFSKNPSTYYSRNFSPCSIFTDWIWKVKIFPFSLLLLSLSLVFLTRDEKMWMLGGGGLRVARELGWLCVRENFSSWSDAVERERERQQIFVRKKAISHNLQFHPRQKENLTTEKMYRDTQKSQHRNFSENSKFFRLAW